MRPHRGQQERQAVAPGAAQSAGRHSSPASHKNKAARLSPTKEVADRGGRSPFSYAPASNVLRKSELCVFYAQLPGSCPNGGEESVPACSTKRV